MSKEEKKVITYCIILNLIIGNGSLIIMKFDYFFIIAMSISCILVLFFTYKYVITVQNRKFFLGLLAFLSTIFIEMQGMVIYILITDTLSSKELNLQVLINILFNSLKGIPLTILGNAFIFPCTLMLSFINYKYFVKYRNILSKDFINP